MYNGRSIYSKKDEMTPTIKLPNSQMTLAAKVLAAAFSADPIVSYFLPKTHAGKLCASERISRAMLRFGQPYQHAYTTAETLKGIAVWLPPNAASRSQIWHLFQSGLFATPVYFRWERIVEGTQFLMRESNNHKKQKSEPHWYLLVLGVAPEYQGQGVGGELILPVLRQADRDETPCYLETSTEGGVRFYQRHGFEIVDSTIVADEMPYWLMKRDPKN